MTRHISEIASGITGSALQARKASNEIGTAPGGTGSVVKSNRLEASPAANDRNLLDSLRPRFGRLMRLVKTAHYHETGAFLATAVSDVEISDEMTETQKAECLAEVERFCLPADKGLILKKLAELRAATNGAKLGEDDLLFEMEVYAEPLLRLPGDCVLAALNRRRKWFPARDEIVIDAERYANTRLKIKAALETYANNCRRN